MCGTSVLALVEFYCFVISVTAICCVGFLNFSSNGIKMVWCGGLSVSLLALCVSGWAVWMSASPRWCTDVSAGWSGAVSSIAGPFLVVSALSVTLFVCSWSTLCWKMYYSIAFVALLTCSWAIVSLVAVSTSVTTCLVRVSGNWILVYWWTCCWSGC